MIRALLPRSLDNDYRGYRTALWVFGFVVGVRILQSLLVLFDGYATARDADGLPMETYTPEAAQQMVALFAQGSLWRLALGALGVVVLVRYRSGVPLMFALLLLHYLAAQLHFTFVPLVRVGTPVGPYMNFALFLLCVAGLLLSLPRSRAAADGERSNGEAAKPLQYSSVHGDTTSPSFDRSEHR